MSTVLCQGLQPYLDQSHLVESTTMKLKVVTPKSLGLAKGLSMVDNEITNEVKEKCQNNDGWNLLQSLSSSPQTPPKKETSYIHPLDKKSSMLMLSERSLELCTESLGSETGSDTCESSILSLSLFDSKNYISTKSIPIQVEERNSNSVPQMESRKAISSRSFPPPLTTISGSNSLQVKPHREGGRLIIQAVKAPSTRSYFQTERIHGRLRLSLWENAVETEEECEEINEEDEALDAQNDMISEVDDDDDDQVEKEDGNDGEINVKNSDMDGINNYDVDVGMGVGMIMGMEKFQRGTAAISRCKEDGHGIGGDKGGLGCNWEAFLVAT